MYTFIMLLMIQTSAGVEAEVYEYSSQSTSYASAYDSCMDAVEIQVFDTMDNTDARVVAGACFEKEDL